MGSAALRAGVCAAIVAAELGGRAGFRPSRIPGDIGPAWLFGVRRGHKALARRSSWRASSLCRACEIVLKTTRRSRTLRVASWISPSVTGRAAPRVGRPYRKKSNQGPTGRASSSILATQDLIDAEGEACFRIFTGRNCACRRLRSVKSGFVSDGASCFTSKFCRDNSSAHTRSHCGGTPRKLLDRTHLRRIFRTRNR